MRNPNIYVFISLCNYKNSIAGVHTFWSILRNTHLEVFNLSRFGSQQTKAINSDITSLFFFTQRKRVCWHFLTYNFLFLFLTYDTDLGCIYVRFKNWTVFYTDIANYGTDLFHWNDPSVSLTELKSSLDLNGCNISR